MIATGRFASRRRPGAALADERGQALVVVLALILVSVVIGTAGIADSTSSQALTTHDQDARRAQQAADAGVQQQLYAESDNDAVGYNFSGGVLGLSTFLDCTVPELNVSAQVIGISAYASTAGACPQAVNTSGTAESNDWTPLDNHDYYESEFFSNKTEQEGSSGSGGGGDIVEFPEIVSIGCDTSSPTTLNTSPSCTGYSRELALLDPTGPLQTVEGENNVTISGLGLLGLGAAAINGNIVADNDLILPTASAALNTSGLSVTTVPPSGTIVPTFGYGNTVSGSLFSTANLVHINGGSCVAGTPSANCLLKRPALTMSTTSCAACASITGSGFTDTADGAGSYSFSMASGTADFPPGNYVFCNFNATGGTINAPYAASGPPSGPVRIFILPPNSSTCTGDAGDFTAGNGVDNVLTDPVNGVSGAVDPSGFQVYVAGSASDETSTTVGAVNVGDTATCALKTLGICVLGSTPPAQEMVVYAPSSTVTMNTGVCLVGLLGSCTVGVAGVFEGSIVGYNVNITAAVITQDLDLGNLPLYGGINSYAVSQTLQCDNSVTHLTSATSDTNGC